MPPFRLAPVSQYRKPGPETGIDSRVPLSATSGGVDPGLKIKFKLPPKTPPLLIWTAVLLPAGGVSGAACQLPSPRKKVLVLAVPEPSRARATVPDARLLAFKLVMPAPEPTKVVAVSVLVV